MPPRPSPKVSANVLLQTSVEVPPTFNPSSLKPPVRVYRSPPSPESYVSDPASALGVDILWRRAANAGGVLQHRPSICAQGYFHWHQFGNVKTMTGAKDVLERKSERKRRKTSMLVCLPKSSPTNSSEVLCRAYSSSSDQCYQKAMESLSEVGEMLSTNDNATEKERGNEEAASASISFIAMEKSNTIHICEGDSGELPNDDIKRNTKNDDVGFDTDAQLASEKGLLSVSIEVGSLMRFVKGKHGFTQRQIQEETGVKIIFPSSKEDTCIVVEGVPDNVSKASDKIKKILGEAAKTPNLDYSHFVSLPLAIHGELVEKLTMFQNSILGETDRAENDNPGSSSDEDCSEGEENRESQENEANIYVNLKVLEDGQHVKVKLGEKSASRTLSDLGIDRSIFIKPKTFHLTVLMLKLYNKERLSLATEVLQKISSKVKDALDNRPIFIKLKGLACMRGSPGKARVVYAPVEEIGGEGRLSRACRVIIDAYLDAGLILKEDAKQTLKLHATLMNVRHRRRKKKRAKKFDYFDARSIFKKYGSEEWGEYLICEAHLSQRFKFGEDGYYHCCTAIPFPAQMQVE